MNLHQKYHDLAQEVFDPRMINNPDDFEAMYATCYRLMTANGMICPEDPEDPAFDTHLPVTEEHPVMSFIYRAGELMELSEKGYVHYQRDGEWVLETLENTTATFLRKDEEESQPETGMGF
jgi:hypothetical protein